MKMLTKAMKQMLDGLAFEHASENLTLREKSAVLKQSNIKAAAPSNPVLNEKAKAGNKARRVALFLGSELPDSVIDYVISTCQSLKHELVVLTMQPKVTANELLEPHQEALAEAGIEMEMVKLSGDPLASLGRYLRKHPEIAFLTCKDSGYLGRTYLMGMQRKDIPVPVVVVTTSEQAQKPLDKITATQNDNQAVVA